MTDFPNVHGPIEIAIDLETIDPHLGERGPGAARRDGRVIGIALGLPGENGRYYPLEGPAEEMTEHPLPAATIRYFRDLLLRPDITVVGANLLYDLLWLRTLGIEAQGPLADVQLAEPLIEENRSTFSLESLSQRYLGRGKLGMDLEEYAASKGWDSHWPHLHEMPISLVGRYAARDAWNTLEVHAKQQKELLAQSLHPIYELECDLIRVVLDMSWRGIRINEERCEQVLHYGRTERDRHIAAMQDIAGSLWDIDIWSVQSLSEVARSLNLPVGVTEKEGDSLDKEFLAKHKDIPFYMHLAEARKFDRCAEVYVKDKILEMAHEGRIYPTWRQGRGDRYVPGGGLSEGVKGTRSGRFSSEAPNLQQLPARHGELASMVRSCLLPDDGEQWMSSDFCYSEDTEILTPDGFRPFPEVVKDKSPVAQMEEDFSISYVRPSRHLYRKFTGEMVNIKGSQQDMLITEDHPVVFFDQRYKKWGKTTIEEFSERHKDYVRIVNAGVMEGEFDMDVDILRLAVAIQADGVIKNTKKYGVSSVVFKLKKERKQTRLKEILVALCIPSTEYELECWPGFKVYYLSGRSLPAELNFLLGKGLKTWDRDCLRDLSLSNRRVLLEELPYWDGSHGGKSGGTFCSSDLPNIDTLQEIAILSGIRTTKCIKSNENAMWPKKPGYFLGLSFKKTMTYVKSSSIERFPVSDCPVYCVTVPSGKIILRRNGKVFVGSNCAQEPRLTVHYGTLINDRAARLIAAAYHENPRTDYHQKVRDMVEEVAGLAIERKQSKTVGLGLSYNMGKNKLMGELGLESDQAEAVINAYHTAVPYVRKLQKMTSAKANSKGFITTLLGRRRHFTQFWRKPYQPGDKPLFFDEAKREWPGAILERVGAYKALNALIQGSAADQTKRAMVLCHRAGLKMLATVHDELCFSVSSEDEIRRAIEIMENAVELEVPMVVDAEVGPSWGELEEWKA